jgi:hypothetical protein
VITTSSSKGVKGIIPFGYTPRGVWYGSQGPQRSVIGRALRNGLAAGAGEAEHSSCLVMTGPAQMLAHLFPREVT